MDNSLTRIQLLEAALDRLKESLDAFNEPEIERYYTQIRDSIIQRFEFSYDLFWKLLKDQLLLKHAIIANSPRTVFQAPFEQQLLNQECFEKALVMIEDRNNVSNRYDERMAQEIAHNAREYYDLMLTTLETLKR